MASARHLEWLSQNSGRNYPFKEDDPLTDISGTFTIPQDFIVDFVLVITLGGPVTTLTRFFLKRLTVFGGTVTAQIFDESDNLAASFTMIQSAHTRYQSYPLQTHGLYENAQGKAVVGSASELFAGPEGRYEFTLATASFEDTTVQPGIRGVTSLTKFSLFDNQPLFDGHVRLEAGVNMRITLDPGTNSIRFDAVAGEGLGPECPCPDPEIFGGSVGPVHTVNGIGPNLDQNFEFRGIGGIKVEPIDNGIQIRNAAASPCCSCDEIDLLHDRVAEMLRRLAELQCTLGASTFVAPTVSTFKVVAADVMRMPDNATATL